MSTQLSLKDLDLHGALAATREHVRNSPQDPKHRIYLFQLLCVSGEWDKARTQLDVLADLDDGALAMIQTYRLALDCEKTRAAVFSGGALPQGFGHPDAWFVRLLEALRLTQAGDRAAGQTLRMAAFDAAPATAGKINGDPFHWIADQDQRFGPVFELFLRGQYFWVPIDRIHRLIVEPPTDLRDVVWMPAHITFTNGGDFPVLIPARYPATLTSTNVALWLGLRTEWSELAPDQFEGLGQRMLVTDVAEYPLLEVRDLQLAPLDTPAASDIAPGH